jgi:hypothetical protein
VIIRPCIQLKEGKRMGFKTWLAHAPLGDDTIGDLVRSLRTDPQFRLTRCTSVKDLINYLTSIEAPSEAVRAAKAAWRRYLIWSAER